jgi:hypothetical protein
LGSAKAAQGHGEIARGRAYKTFPATLRARVLQDFRPSKPMRGGGAPKGAPCGSGRSLRGRNAGAQRPRKRLPALHRGDFGLGDRASGDLAQNPRVLIPAVSRHSPVPRPADGRRQSLVMGPDGDPLPPECARLRWPHARRRRTPPRSKTPHEAPLADGMDVGILSYGKIVKIYAAQNDAYHCSRLAIAGAPLTMPA